MVTAFQPTLLTDLQVHINAAIAMPMGGCRLIVAGSRDFAPDRIIKSKLVPGMDAARIDNIVRRFLFDIFDASWATMALNPGFFAISAVISGGAVGADTYGELWATRDRIPVRQYLPDYDAFPNPLKAPLARNEEMAAVGDALIAVSLGESTGTAHMIRMARARDLPVVAVSVPRATLSRVLRLSTRTILAT